MQWVALLLGLAFLIIYALGFRNRQRYPPPRREHAHGAAK
jgi:hypothetical protein